VSRQTNGIAAVLSILAATTLISILSTTHVAVADCNMPGNSHGDNSPSEKKGWKMINGGASACDIAQACDAMKIDVYIKSEDRLHDTAFYQQASSHVQDELDEYMKDGNGHHGIVCYEIEESVDG
jgi:hypothetical protein